MALAGGRSVPTYLAASASRNAPKWSLRIAPGKGFRFPSSGMPLVATCGQLVAKQKKKARGFYTSDLRFHGRDDWIRTSGLTVPNRARYQTAPRPDIVPYVNSPEGTSPVSQNSHSRTHSGHPSTLRDSDGRSSRRTLSRGFVAILVATTWPACGQPRPIGSLTCGSFASGSSFETTFPRSRTVRATKLRHVPMQGNMIAKLDRLTR